MIYELTVVCRQLYPFAFAPRYRQTTPLLACEIAISATRQKSGLTYHPFYQFTYPTALPPVLSCQPAPAFPPLALLSLKVSTYQQSALVFTYLVLPHELTSVAASPLALNTPFQRRARRDALPPRQVSCVLPSSLVD